VGEVTGFLRYERRLPARRAVAVRLRDWREVYEPFSEEETRTQAARCMDCGIPFCHEACPLGNVIPEWNDLVYRGGWAEAAERLHSTNNFPEFTGRLCPAPCEGACVLETTGEPVAIERVEYEIAERAWSCGLVRPITVGGPTSKSVAIVGSGPAGLAAAQQLRRVGHRVVVFEAAHRPGGLLRYGIPEFKLEKAILDRRLGQLEAEGVDFRCGVIVGQSSGHSTLESAKTDERRLFSDRGPDHANVIPARELLRDYDAVVLAIGATVPRDLEVPGRSLAGIYQAMAYLKPCNELQEGSIDEAPISASGKDVVIIGGGDTGADCLGSVHRQGARSVHQLEIMPLPPGTRSPANPWPTWPLTLRSSAAHDEGGRRLFSISTVEFLDDGSGAVSGLRAEEVESVPGADGRTSFSPVPDSGFILPCQLVLLALGFAGPERTGILCELEVDLDRRNNIAVDAQWSTSAARVFACGDGRRGQSLVVWAIAEGRSAAAAVDRALRGDTGLPAPIAPGRASLS